MGKRLLKIILFVLFTTSLYAQNLIKNPGFEDGLNSWSELWTRNDNSGDAEVVLENFYSGTKALLIEHWGSQDWSLAYSQILEVNTGEIYEFSVWAYVENVSDWIECSVVLYDSSFNVIDWSYGAKGVVKTEEYEQVTSRFIVPENASYILPRFTGNDSSKAYFDEAFLSLVGSSSQGKNLALENDFLKIELTTSPFSFKATTAENNIFESEEIIQFSFESVDTIENGYVLDGNYIPDNFDIHLSLSLNGNALKFELIADSANEMSDEILFPGRIKSKANDYLIIPRAAGMILPVDKEYPYWRFQFYGHKATMSYIGTTNLESGFMILSHNPWDTEVEFVKDDESLLYSPQLIHSSSKGNFGYKRVFEYYFYDEGGYVSMGKDYRTYAEKAGFVKTFEDKIADNPNVEKLIGAVDFWALKPEFRTNSFLDSLKSFGVGKALISIAGGWFADEDMTEIIDSINSLGFLSSRYDIYTDVWPPDYPQYNWLRREGYPEDVIVTKDGELQKGWLTYLDGTIPFQGYYTSSSTHPELAAKRISEDPTGKNYSARFIDVELSSPLYENYSENHPQTRMQDANDRSRTLDVVKNGFNLVTGSEEARDWAFPNVDFGEGTMSIQPAENAGYDWSTPIEEPGDGFINFNINPTVRLPLHGLVYHDVHVPTWYTGDGVSKVPAFWDDKDLFNILYGTMPLIMPPDYNYWLQNRERFLETYHLVASVFERTGKSKMISHQFLSEDKKVQETRFENGWTVVVNFDDEAYNYNGIILAPKGFYASNGEELIYKLIENDFEVSAAELNSGTYVNPQTKEFNFYSSGSTTLDNFWVNIRSDGAIYFDLSRLNDGYFDYTLIGEQEYFDYYTQEGEINLGIYTIDNDKDSAEVKIEYLEDDWIRIFKHEDKRFYRAYYLLSDIENEQVEEEVEIDDGLPKDFALFQNYPNPFNPITTISYQLPKAANVKIEVFNVLGNKVEKLLDERQPSGYYNIEFDASNHTSGIYFYRITADEFSETKKMILVK